MVDYNRKIIRFSASAAPKSNCMLRLKRMILDGLQEPLPWNDTQYGSAVHKFISTMHETQGDFAKATIEAKRVFSKPCEIRTGKKHLTEVHMLKTCFDYWEHYQKTDDFEVFADDSGKPLVEVTFSNTVYQDEQLEIRFEGVMDKVGKFKGGCAAVGDYKVTSSWNIAEYMDQYDLSTQLRFYVFNLKLHARNNPESALAKICQGSLGYFVDGIFISKEGAQFRRSEVIIPSDADINEFGMLLANKIVPMLVTMARNPDYNMRDGLVNGACVENKYKCEFCRLCNAPDDIARQHMIKSQYVSKPYLPMEHSKD